MRYSYVEPVAVDSRILARTTVTKVATPILKRSSPIPASHPAVPAAARRLVEQAAGTRPQWTFKLTHSVTLNDKGNGIIDHVFIRVYGRNGEPLGHCGWSGGHTTGARIWNARPSGPIPFAFVGFPEFCAWVRNQPYTPPPPTERGSCPRCTAIDVRLKKDGSPYKHKDPDMGMECT